MRKVGVGIKDKVDGAVAIRFEVTGTNLRDEVLVRREDSYLYGLAILLVRDAHPAQQSLEGLHR